MVINTNKNEIDKILNRGVVVDAIPSLKEFREKLLSGDKLRFYIGADPTSSSLHLSHAKNYMLLEEFRKLGHEVIVLIGDFTARIGDPTGNIATRKQLSREDVVKNVETWLDQLGPLMDFKAKENPPRILYNNEWFSKMEIKELVEVASNLTVQQLLERDMFEKRMKQGKPIFLHEFLYPLLQGYDSVKMDVDVEMCGTDQIFNALVGRALLKKLGNKEKFVLVVNLMENPKTKELMSKTRGFGVFLDLPPIEMFGAIMAQPDEMIELFLVNNTRLSLEEIKRIKETDNPKDAKMVTAFEVVKIFCGKKEAKKARDSFEKVFQKKELPDEVEEVSIKKGDDLKEWLLSNKYVSSSGEYRRLVNDGAIEFDREVIKDVHYKIEKSGVVRIGKKKFVKLVI